jgi:cytochrome c
VAFGSAEGRVVVADAASGAIVRDFRARKGPVWGLALAQGAHSLVLAGLDDFVTRVPLDDDFLAVAAADGREPPPYHAAREQGNGAAQFARKCSVCHSLDVDDRRRAGPTLYGVFGRRAGSLPGYPYSPALAKAPVVWDEQTIDALFKDGPDVVTPGSKMPLQRIAEGADRRDLIEFLKSRTAPGVVY